jgi:tRNA dimethylallyltransferase
MVLIVICGATASGKSGLAIDIGRRLGGEIISADSRQVYREFDLGTAKVSTAELALIPHHLIDSHPPTATVTVAEYQALAQPIIANLQARGQIPLLVGGTGLYIKSIVRGMKIPAVPPQPELRSQLTKLGQIQAYQILQSIDPISASKIHARDPIRTTRALEVFYATGKTISSLQGESPPDYPIIQIGLDCRDLDALTDRIRHRTQQMISQGWEAEVSYLVTKYGEDLPLLNTLGYAEMRSYLRKEINLTDAIDSIVLHTRQFAKRQLTWFRAIPEIQWFDSDDPHLSSAVWNAISNWRSRSIPNRARPLIGTPPHRA